MAVWALPHASQACSCAPPLPPSVAADRADAVFEARVEAVAADAANPDSFMGIVHYDLEVLRVWKGELGPSTRLSTRASGAACGRTLVVGKVYVLYASKRDDGELTDSMCSRTRLSSTADEDLATLGPGNAPAGGRPTTEPTTREPPRIAPPPPDLGPPAVARKGCAVDSTPPGGLWLLASIFLWFYGTRGLNRPRR